FCLARSCTPKSDSLPLRRWPCWPGPYSRRFTGLFGRPQIFWPIRRSILYFASLRFVIASSALGLSFEETRPPVHRHCRGRQVRLESFGEDHGSRNATRAETGPRASGFLGRNRGSVNEMDVSFRGAKRTRNLEILRGARGAHSS